MVAEAVAYDCGRREEEEEEEKEEGRKERQKDRKKEQNKERELCSISGRRTFEKLQVAVFVLLLLFFSRLFCPLLPSSLLFSSLLSFPLLHSLLLYNRIDLLKYEFPVKYNCAKARCLYGYILMSILLLRLLMVLTTATPMYLCGREV